MQKKIFINLLVISLFGILLTTVAIYVIQTKMAYNKADVTTSTRLDNVVELMRQNELQIEELMEAYNEDLLSNAHSLAIMIEMDPDVINDKDRLDEIAVKLNIDELHIIDEHGILRWGTIPMYFGMDFATTEQTKPFLDIIDDPSLEIVQEPMPNGFIGLFRQYAAVSLRNQKGVAQVGVDPIRLENALKNNQINNVLSGLTVGNTGYVFSISESTGNISYHPDTRLIGKALEEELHKTGFITVNNQKVRYHTQSYNGQMLVAVIPVNELYAERTTYTVFFLGLMFVMFIVFFSIINTFIKKNVIVGISKTLQTLEEVSAGNLDVTANVYSSIEFKKLSDGINQMLQSIKTRNQYKVQARNFGALKSVAGSGVIIKDRDGVITDWNVGAQNILGYRPDEVIGKTSAVYSRDSKYDVIQETNQRLFMGESVIRSEDEVIHKDGRVVICSTSYSPIFNSGGKVTGSVVVFHDVTAEKEAVQKVKNLAAIVAIADAGIIIKDKDGIVLEWNIGAENILGFKPHEIIGKTTKQYAPDESHSDIDDVNTRLRKGEHITHKEVVRKHKNGRLIDCSVSYTPLFSDDGSFNGSVSIFHDISDKKQIEHELRKALITAEKASNVKSDFLANMSHEIRTPMNAVIGMADLLLSEDLTSRQRRYANDIKSSGNNLLGIINNILDLSKIESGNFEISPVDFDFISFLENIDSIFRFTSKSKRIEYLSETLGDLPKCLYGDDIRLRQVLTNLLGNAVKFTSEGHVKLTTWVNEDQVFFDVSDTGLGIREKDLGALFDAFQRMDKEANREKTGTGLGLSITKNIIEAMGGTIAVESEYGKGSVFHVQIPLVEGNPENIKIQPVSYPFISAPKANVLVVDDFDINLSVTSGLLKLSDIDCDTALSGNEAILMVKNKKYDIIFMDHMMPGMDGVATTQKIREMGYGKKDYPIVALTANAIEGVREFLLDSGMNDFLSKPIDKVLLNEILIKWLPPEKVHTERNDAILHMVESTTEDYDLSRFYEIKELDVDMGLERMAGSKKMYWDTLRIITKRIPELMKIMTNHLDHNEWERFTINVHGIKNSLATIGANELSSTALDLELKAKERDKEFCIQRFPEFIHHLDALHKELQSKIQLRNASVSNTGDKQNLKLRLEEAKIRLEAFDDENALHILEGLLSFDFGSQTNEKLKALYDQIELFEYENAHINLDVLLETLMEG